LGRLLRCWRHDRRYIKSGQTGLSKGRIDRYRGQNESPDEAARFKKDVLANKPALVIWQVGTNAAWKDYFLDDVRAAILRGLDHLANNVADVVLMNLQFAPALLDQKEAPTSATQQMQDIIATIAKDSGVALFQRFDPAGPFPCSLAALDCW
jgi:hypothetical protein